jgi:hypothetical protein
MKVFGTVILAGAVLACTLTYTIAARADSTAVWAVSGLIRAPHGDETVKPVCKFVSHGDAFKGTCTGTSNVGPAVGSTSGRDVMFRWSHRPHDADGWIGVATFKGVLGSDGVVRGTWIDTSFPHWVGTWEAKRL